MSDPENIINLTSSPPASPLFELPTVRNKVSEMCKDYHSKENELVNFNSIHYHTISDSEDEYPENNSNPSKFENYLPQLIFSENGSSSEVIEQPFLSQNSNEKVYKNESIDKNRLKEIKAKEKAEKAKERAEKTKEKAYRAAMLERIRQSKPGQCIKFVTIILDENLLNCNIGKKAVDLFKDVEFKFKVETQKDPCSVTWIREEPGSPPTVLEEKHILFIWSCDKLITSVKFCTLIDTFRDLKSKYPGFSIYFAIYGLGDYFRIGRRSDEAKIPEQGKGEAVRKRRKTTEISKEQIDVILAELEVVYKISVRFLKNHHELSVLFQQITKAIAETPYRKEIDKRDLEKSWYTRGDSRDCVKIDKDLNGMHRLWLQQLSQFNKTSLDAAKSIAEVYPSPFSLYQAYQNLSIQKEKELLLRDIKIKKGNVSTRRVGPELSRKISLLFSQENGDIYLSQE